MGLNLLLPEQSELPQPSPRSDIRIISGYTPLNIDKAWHRLSWGEHKVNIIRWMPSSVNHVCSLFCSIKQTNQCQLLIGIFNFEMILL